MQLDINPKGHWFDYQSGHMPGFGPGLQYGACERQPHIDVSLPLFFPPFPSLKINKIFKTEEKVF